MGSKAERRLWRIKRSGGSERNEQCERQRGNATIEPPGLRAVESSATIELAEGENFFLQRSSPRWNSQNVFLFRLGLAGHFPALFSILFVFVAQHGIGSDFAFLHAWLIERVDIEQFSDVGGSHLEKV